jgi:hypothetical protein
VPQRAQSPPAHGCPESAELLLSRCAFWAGGYPKGEALGVLALYLNLVPAYQTLGIFPSHATRAVFVGSRTPIISLGLDKSFESCLLKFWSLLGPWLCL